MAEIPLFVHGLLRQGAGPLSSEGSAFAEGLRRTSRFLGLGRTQGRLYLAPGWGPVLLEADGPGQWVAGDLLAAPEAEEFWRLLDEFEDAGPEPEALPDPRFSARRLVLPVRLESGDSTAAWGYLCNRAVEEEWRIASGDARL